jgi:hypothetical protein
MLLGDWFPAFGDNTVLPSRVERPKKINIVGDLHPEDETNTFARNDRNQLPSDAASYPRRTDTLTAWL